VAQWAKRKEGNIPIPLRLIAITVGLLVQIVLVTVVTRGYLRDSSCQSGWRVLMRFLAFSVWQRPLLGVGKVVAHKHAIQNEPNLLTYNVPMKKVVHTVCSHDCPDACGILVTVVEMGAPRECKGTRHIRVTRGFLCAKVTKYLDRVYSPDRVMYPMRRTALKGQGKGDASDFARISWDEALNEISSRFKKISDEFGPEGDPSLFLRRQHGVLSYSGMAHRFFHRLGASQLDRTICASAGGAGMQTVIGRNVGTEPEQFRDSKYIIAWGANIHATQRASVAVHCRGTAQWRQTGGDRSLQDAHGEER